MNNWVCILNFSKYSWGVILIPRLWQNWAFAPKLIKDKENCLPKSTLRITNRNGTDTMRHAPERKTHADSDLKFYCRQHTTALVRVMLWEKNSLISTCPCFKTEHNITQEIETRVRKKTWSFGIRRIFQPYYLHRASHGLPRQLSRQVWMWAWRARNHPQAAQWEIQQP